MTGWPIDLTPVALLLVAIASVAAGAVNAVAGGGTLLAFPALTVLGMPTVEANVTTTVALTPGYVGGSLAQRADLRGQRARLARLAPAAAIGGLGGALLLVVTAEDLFRLIVPWLLFAASGVLAAQDQVRAAVERRQARRRRAAHHSGVGAGAVAATFAAGLYGGYFGAALGIILLAVLGVVLDDDLRRINALKQALSLVANVAASMLLLFSGRLPWAAAAVMAAGSLAGGSLGGRVAHRIHPTALRRVVVVIGVAVGLVYLVKR